MIRFNWAATNRKQPQHEQTLSRFIARLSIYVFMEMSTRSGLSNVHSKARTLNINLSKLINNLLS